jgi:hypothetical protein
MEPFHACSSACSFTGRTCTTTRKVHVCSSRCVLLDTETNYVCTVTGLVFAGSTVLHTCSSACVFHDSAQNRVCTLTGLVQAVGHSRHSRAQQHTKTRRIRDWVYAGLLLFLTETEARAAAAAAFFVRATARIRRQMGSVWNAQLLSKSASCAQKWISARHPLINLLANSLVEYYDRFANGLFKATRPGITTFVAVMINALSKGIFDVSKICIVPKNELVARCAPPLIDYPKLSQKIVSCKAMSTGEYGIRRCAVSATGSAYARAVFRLADG